MARLLVLAVAALAVLTAPPGKQLMTARAARPSPAEAFWCAALPDAPMPEAIRELLHPKAAGTKDPNVNDKPPLPPLNFKYDDYKSSPRNEAATAPSPEVLRHLAGGARGDTAASPPTVLCFLEDAVRVGGSLPLRCVPRAAAVEGVVRERGEAVAAAIIACHVNRARPGGDPARTAFRLVGVMPGGAPVICHAVPGAQGLPVKNDGSPSSA
ncbi:hypothetical protein PAHAL_2G307600 [Panicum hallii]|uniref:BURP domain-containing protein n=1 Tax=Panicum hallii TaxID=206008 RepID=A0A2S3H0M5_9POAL|nr:BURP domain-containing protein 15-like [Panicum hallii]PAN13012.1 hypothetical protein PAHAL_2G307600 [Panicum hallii]